MREVLLIGAKDDDMKELKVQALIENLDQVIAFLDTELEAVECPMKEQMLLF